MADVLPGSGQSVSAAENGLIEYEYEQGSSPMSLKNCFWKRCLQGNNPCLLHIRSRTRTRTCTRSPQFALPNAFDSSPETNHASKKVPLKSVGRTRVSILVAQQWEQHDVADAARVGQQHDEAIDANAQSTSWRHAIA